MLRASTASYKGPPGVHLGVGEYGPDSPKKQVLHNGQMSPRFLGTLPIFEQWLELRIVETDHGEGSAQGTGEGEEQNKHASSVYSSISVFRCSDWC